MIARFRTAGRVCSSIGTRTGKGLTPDWDVYWGNRVTNTDKIDNVSMAVSGGVDD